MESLMSTLANNFELDCAICLSPFSTPIFQCRNGHSVCPSCEQQCQQCPVCRTEMPGQKIRNLYHERILTFIRTSVPVPCPNQLDGCTQMLKQDGTEMENHKLECAFIKKKICSQLGLNCSLEHNRNEMIAHFIFDHNLDGAIVELGDCPTSNPPKLQLAHYCNKSELRKYLTAEWTKPNFISFDGKMFFVRKGASVSLKLVTLMVYIDASSDTASRYSARVQLYPQSAIDSENGNILGMAPSFQFEQREIARLTEKFDRNSPKCCRIPIAEIEQCGQVEDGRRSSSLSWMFQVSISKNDEACTATVNNHVNVPTPSTSIIHEEEPRIIRGRGRPRGSTRSPGQGQLRGILREGGRNGRQQNAPPSPVCIENLPTSTPTSRGRGRGRVQSRGQIQSQSPVSNRTRVTRSRSRAARIHETATVPNVGHHRGQYYNDLESVPESDEETLQPFDWDEWVDFESDEQRSPLEDYFRDDRGRVRVRFNL